MRTRTLEKMCDCKRATASGPRIVLTPTQRYGSGYRLVAQMVERACDRCNEPWRVSPEERHP